MLISQHNYLHLYPNVAQFGSVLPEIYMDGSEVAVFIIDYTHRIELEIDVFDHKSRKNFNKTKCYYKPTRLPNG